METYHGRKSGGFRESTRDDYRRDLQYAFRLFGPRKQLRQITPATIRAFVAWLNDPVAQGRQLAPSTLRNKVAPLAACLATAVDDGLLRVNPAASVTYPAPRIDPEAHTLDGEFDEGVKALNREQLGAFLGIVNPCHRLMFEFLAATGLRVGELIALEWRHLDLDGGNPKVRVTRQFYKGRLGPPKSRHGKRRVPLTLDMADALRGHRAALGGRDPRLGADDAFVFPSSGGERLTPSNVHRRVLKPAAAEAGVGWAGFHTFRHTCASMLISEGRNVLQASRWLGHHSPEFTLRTYSHLMDEGVGGGLRIVKGGVSNVSGKGTEPHGNPVFEIPDNLPETREIRQPAVAHG